MPNVKGKSFPREENLDTKFGNIFLGSSRSSSWEKRCFGLVEGVSGIIFLDLV